VFRVEGNRAVPARTPDCAPKRFDVADGPRHERGRRRSSRAALVRCR
jgi:hypothetical protein